MQISAHELVETLGPCTDDVRDCEVLRAAFAHQDNDPDNEKSQAIRYELAKVACDQCKKEYSLPSQQ